MTTTIEQSQTIETYEVELPEDAISQLERDSLADELEQRKQLAKALGLTKQIELLDERYQEAEWEKTIPFPRMTDHEWEVWHAYLPTRYQEEEHQVGNRSLRHYRFDCIPFSVLALWNDLKEKQVFDAFEVWTPERQHPDPILVGLKKVGNEWSRHYWLIARWGESLKPFAEIEEEVKTRKNAPVMPPHGRPLDPWGGDYQPTIARVALLNTPEHQLRSATY